MKSGINKFEENFFNKELTRATTKSTERYTGNEGFDKIVKEWHDISPKMNDFVIKSQESLKPNQTNGIYPKDEVIKDAEFVKNFENKHKFQETQVNISEAVAAETTFLQGVHEYGWLGDDIAAGSTHRYDDYKNSMDAFISHHSDDGKNDFVLGFDITTSSADEILERKIYKNIQKLDTNILGSKAQNALHEIKYFQDTETNEKKKVYVPRIVLVVNIDDIKNLMDKFTKKNNLIANDPIKNEIRKQITTQLTIAMEQIINKYIDNNFKSTKNNWQEALNNNLDKIKQHPELAKLLETYIHPLEYFS